MEEAQPGRKWKVGSENEENGETLVMIVVEIKKRFKVNLKGERLTLNQQWERERLTVKVKGMGETYSESENKRETLTVKGE